MTTRQAAGDDVTALCRRISELEAQLGSRGADHYRALIDGFPLAIQIMSLDSRRLYVNDAFLGLLGYATKEEIYAMPRPAEFVAPHERERITRIRLARERGGSAPSSYDIDYVRTDGSIVRVQVISRPVVWDGEPANQRTYIDLTERQQAAKALRESEARYRDLIEGSNLGIQIGSPERGRILTNRACAELFGYDRPDDLLSVPRHGLVAEHDQEKVSDFHNAMFKGEDVELTYEMDGVRKDGSIIPLQVFARRIVWQGKDAVHRTYIDLTERKRAEEQLRQAQKMEAVGQLTGGIAHDFNNLLTVVIGCLDFIERRLDDAKLKSLAQNALRASCRGGELTQRLLSYSRKQSLAPRVINLNDYATGMVELMRSTLGETVEVQVSTNDGLWNCTADYGQLEVAVLNLAINARDAMPDGGRINIETRNVCIEDDVAATQPGASPGEYVMISVTDTGTGIPEELIDRVFEPFFTTKEVGAGSGLGLSMVYGFINQSGGHVFIESGRSGGTTVRLYLPRSPETHEPAPPVTQVEMADGNGERILLVEDQADVSAAVAIMLKELGHHVVEAGEAKEALEILRNSPDFDAIVTDVVLPGGMNGLDLAGQVKRRIPAIKVLVITGYAADSVMENDGVEKKYEPLKKPFNKLDLGRRLRSLLDP